MEIAGPTKTGGIGTHCYYLAKFLRQSLGHEVTVLLGTPLKEKDSAYWRAYFKEKIDVEFEYLDDYPPFSTCYSMTSIHYALIWSLNICARLKDCSYDVCHFQENNANAFVPTAAKMAGLHFRDTIFTTTLHSPDRWIREANRVYTHTGSWDLAMDYMEKKAAEKCDFVIAPVNYMLNYVSELGWKVEDKARVIPYLIDGIDKAPKRSLNKNHIIFFGRLETRKGLEIFVDALAGLPPPRRESEQLKVTFLGKPGTADGRDALDYLKEYGGRKSAHQLWEIKTDMDHFQATSYLRDHSDALVVTASPVDNSPFTVIECLEMGLNVISAASGGIPELIGGPGRLFPPTAQGLRSKLAEIYEHGLSDFSPDRYSKEKAEREWSRFANFLEDESRSLKKAPHLVNRSAGSKSCVILTPGRTNGMLAASLDSLEKQTKQDFQLVAVTGEANESDQVAMQGKYARDSWTFVSEKNGRDGPLNNGSENQSGRNKGLSLNESDYLIFMEDDCLAEPDMVETLENSIECLNADAVTCFYRSFFKWRKSPNEFFQSRYFYGNSRELGLISNCFGENVFIIRREVFQSLGGFTNDSENITPDWEFFVRLCSQNYRLEIVPKFLFQKRIFPQNRVSTYNYYYSHMKSIEPVMENLGNWERNVTSSYLGMDRYNKILNAKLNLQMKGQPIPDTDFFMPNRELENLQNNYFHLMRFPLLYKKYKRKLVNFIFDKNEKSKSRR